MNNINRLIRYYVCEILVVLAFVAISIPIWNQLDKSGVAKVANSYHTMDYLYLDIDKYVSDKEFEDVIAVVNDTNTLRGYELVLKIEKDKITENTIVKINDEAKLINELEFETDNIFNYYIIAKGNIVASQNDYKVSFMNSEIKYNEIEYEIIENHEV